MEQLLAYVGSNKKVDSEAQRIAHEAELARHRPSVDFQEKPNYNQDRV